MSTNPIPLRRPRVGLRHLASYAPGACDVVFTRASQADYSDSTGLVVAAASGIRRDRHFEGGRLAALVERAGVQSYTAPDDVNNAAWTKTAVTIGTATTAPDGTASAKLVIPTAVSSSHRIEQVLPALTANALQVGSACVKSGGYDWIAVRTSDKAGVSVMSWVNTATGAISGAGGHTISVHPVSGGIRVIVLWNSGTGASTPSMQWWVTNANGVSTMTGDGVSGVYFWRLNFEKDVDHWSSTMSGASRAADVLSVPMLGAPQESTFYVRLTNRTWSLSTNGADHYICSIGTGTPRIIISRLNTSWVMYHITPIGTVSSPLTSAVAMGDLVELRGILYRDGSVQIGASINGGAEVMGLRSLGLDLQNAWSTPRLYLGSNSGGGNSSSLALHRALVPPGVIPMDVVRLRAA